MRKVFSTLLIIIVTLSAQFGYVYADNNVKAVNKVVLSYEEAEKLLIKNNIDLQLADKKIEIYEDKYKDAKSAAQEAERQLSYNTLSNLKYRKAEKLDHQRVALELSKLYNNKVELNKKLKNQLKKSFININLLNKDIEAIKEEITLTNNKETEVKLKVKIGQAKEIDLKSITVQKLNLQNQLNVSNNELNNQLSELKKLLCIETSTIVGLNQLDLKFAKIDEKSVLDKFTSCIQSDFNFNNSNKELALLRLERDLTSMYTLGSENEDMLTELDNSIAELEASIEQQKINIEADLWIEYYSIKLLEDNIDIAQLNLEICKADFDSSQLKEKLGMISSASAINTRLEYSRQKNNLQRALNNYILAAGQFNEKLGLQQQ